MSTKKRLKNNVQGSMCGEIKAISKRRSMFYRLLVPLILIVLLEVGVIAAALFFGGTITAIDRNAVENLSKNAENRANQLQTDMAMWSKIDDLESSVIKNIEKKLVNELSPREFLSNREVAGEILAEMSEEILLSLRILKTTGVFILFCQNFSYGDNLELNGVYYRDLNPLSSQSDYSDVLYYAGMAAIAQRDKIPFDSYWAEKIIIPAGDGVLYDSFIKPMSIAAENPHIMSNYLSYWAPPHEVHGDSRRAFTYTRPLIVKGEVVGVIGTEILDSVFAKSIPVEDFNSKDTQKGYAIMLVDSSELGDKRADIRMMYTTGAFVTRELSSNRVFKFTNVKADGTRRFTLGDESFRCVWHELRLYGSNSPFADKTWLMSAVSSERELFSLSSQLISMIVMGSGVGFLIGIVLLSVLVNANIRPLAVITRQIVANERISVKTSSINYEAHVLTNAINEMRDNRDLMEKELRAERERYLVALSSAANIIIEYDGDTDTLTQLFFVNIDRLSRINGDVETVNTADIKQIGNGKDYGGNKRLMERETPNFAEKISKDLRDYFFTKNSVPENYAGNLNAADNNTKSNRIPNYTSNIGIHPEDLEPVLEFFQKDERKDIKARFLPSFFSNAAAYSGEVIPQSEITDDGYLWFELNCTRINENYSWRVIGTADNITANILADRVEKRKLLRDHTTGFYKKKYGLEKIRDEIEKDREFRGRILHLVNKDRDWYESMYGFVFCECMLYCSIQGTLRLGYLFPPEQLPKRRIFARLNVVSTLVYDNEDLTPEFLNAESKAVGMTYTGEDTEHFFFAPPTVYNCGVENKREEGIKTLEKIVYEVSERDIERYTANYIKENYQGVDFTAANAVSITLDLFQQSKDFVSSLKMLINVLGFMFDFERVIIMETNLDFYSNHILAQWSQPKLEALVYDSVKVSKEAYDKLVKCYEKGVMLEYKSNDAIEFSDMDNADMRQLLCMVPEIDSHLKMYSCAIFENSIQKGRIVYVSSRSISSRDSDILTEITHIISTNYQTFKHGNASRAKSEFLSRISHEIRTPMNAIIGLNKMAVDSANNIANVVTIEEMRLNSYKTLEYLNKIDTASNHLLSLINDVLDMSRIESGKLAISSAEFSIDKLADTVETLINPQIQANSLVYTCKREYSNPNVVGDENRIRQVLVNFLGNATKFTPQGGAITLLIKELDTDPKLKKSKYLFSVKDTGIGIKEEDLTRIFSAFEQSETDKKSSGTGLGLAISKNFILAMGSTISLESEYGKGSEFSFTLELSRSVNSADGNAETEIEYDFSGKRVLLVDDNEINLEIANYIFSDLRFEVETAVDGLEAFEKFVESVKEDPYQIIAMDIQMPVLDGIESTKLIRRFERENGIDPIPIIAMTANAFDEDMKKTVEAGMNGYASKPIDVNAVCIILDKLLNK